MHGVISHPDRMSYDKCYFIVKMHSKWCEKTNNRDPDQLASSCGVEKTTVDPDEAS